MATSRLPILLPLLLLAACTACRAALEQNWTQYLELPSWDEDEWQELDPDCEESLDGSFAVTQGRPRSVSPVLHDQGFALLGRIGCVYTLLGSRAHNTLAPYICQQAKKPSSSARPCLDFVCACLFTVSSPARYSHRTEVTPCARPQCSCSCCAWTCRANCVHPERHIGR